MDETFTVETSLGSHVLKVVISGNSCGGGRVEVIFEGREIASFPWSQQTLNPCTADPPEILRFVVSSEPEIVPVMRLESVSVISVSTTVQDDLIENNVVPSVLNQQDANVVHSPVPVLLPEEHVQAFTDNPNLTQEQVRAITDDPNLTQQQKDQSLAVLALIGAVVLG